MFAVLFYRFHPKIRGIKSRRSLRFITALIAFAQLFERLCGRSYGCHPANRPGGDGAIQVSGLMESKKNMSSDFKRTHRSEQHLYITPNCPFECECRCLSFSAGTLSSMKFHICVKQENK